MNEGASIHAPIQLFQPSEISFGSGTAANVGKWLSDRKCRRTLIVTDPFNAARVATLGIEGAVSVFAEIATEPDDATLLAAIRQAEHFGPDAVVGFGGGSAMDVAKLCAVLPGSGLDVHDVVGVDRTPARTIRLVQVPTTSGTGSEAGMRALVTDKRTDAKLAVQAAAMLADLAVVDPDLTLTVPPALTAATGVDALAHCVEAYTSRRAHPAIDLYAIEGIRLIGRHLATAIADGGNVEARAALSLASLYGGFCLGPVNTTAGHAVAYPLGTRYRVPHGAANALIFPHTLAFNAVAVPERTAQVLDALGLPAATDPDAIRQATGDYCRRLGCEMAMSNYGVAPGELAAMANEANQIRRLLDNNPRDIGEADILAIYEAAI